VKLKLDLPRGYPEKESLKTLAEEVEKRIGRQTVSAVDGPLSATEERGRTHLL